MKKVLFLFVIGFLNLINGYSQDISQLKEKAELIANYHNIYLQKLQENFTKFREEKNSPILQEDLPKLKEITADLIKGDFPDANRDELLSFVENFGNFGINIVKRTQDEQISYYIEISRNKDFAELVATFNSAILNIQNIEELISIKNEYDEKAMGLNFGENQLLCFFAFTSTAVKSYEYWSQNIDKWNDLTNNQSSVNSRRANRERDACIADANGIVQGMLTGAIGGLTGGPVGAILGGFTGSFLGGMCGSAFSYFGWDFR